VFRNEIHAYLVAIHFHLPTQLLKFTLYLHNLEQPVRQFAHLHTSDDLALVQAPRAAKFSNMKPPTTPPYSDSGCSDRCDAANFQVQAPISPAPSSPEKPRSRTRISGFYIPVDLTQAAVEASSQLKRLQQDLLVLTSFADNSSLTWRPSWFLPPTYPSVHWTLHNPPDVVTEELPRDRSNGRQIMTRRMRQEGDREPLWMTTQLQWESYCDMYGVPYDFLCEDMIRLLRLGLPRHSNGQLCRK
jgi:hypothetical protein